MSQFTRMPTVQEILSEWTLDNVEVATAIWMHGIDRYEATDLEDRGEMILAADEMGLALAWFLSRPSGGADGTGLLPDSDIAVITWNVLVASLGGDSDELMTSGSDRSLRVAAAVVRELGCQSEELGGSGLMAEVFDDEESCNLIELALGRWPGSESGEPVTLEAWFEGKPKAKPRLSLPGANQDPPTASATKPMSVLSTFGKSKLLGSAKAAVQGVSPTTIQHGIDAMHGALTESKLAKPDRKTGKLRIKKTGVMRAAIRPGKTIRKAIDGASIAEHFRSIADEGAGDPPS